MKFFVATDVHGSAFWAKKIVEKFQESQADVLVLLGDIYNHGPRNPFPQDYAPMEVAEILAKIADRLVVVQGNCDSEVDQMISNFTFVNHYQVCVDKPQSNTKRRLFFTHGHIFNKDNLPCLSQGDVLFFGHFHTNAVVVVDGITCVCVGSCALPKDEKLWYCLTDGQQVSFFDFNNNKMLEQKF